MSFLSILLIAGALFFSYADESSFQRLGTSLSPIEELGKELFFQHHKDFKQPSFKKWMLEGLESPQ